MHLILPVFFVMCGVLVYAQRVTPKLTSATANGKRGDLITFSGANLAATLVQKLYMTDAEHDFQVALAEQSATVLKFRIPDGVPPGRFAFMVLTTGADAKFIALTGFKITIDELGTFQIDDAQKSIRAACATIYRKTADKKVGDLTVAEEQDVRRCQNLGLYSPR